MSDPSTITLRRLPNGTWRADGPNGRERVFSQQAAEYLDLIFGKPAEGGKR